MAPDVTGVPGSERTSAIRNNRMAERQDLQRRDAVRAEQPDEHEKGKVVSFSTSLPANNHGLPDITEILRSFSQEEVEE